MFKSFSKTKLLLKKPKSRKPSDVSSAASSSAAAVSTSGLSTASPSLLRRPKPPPPTTSASSSVTRKESLKPVLQSPKERPRSPATEGAQSEPKRLKLVEEDEGNVVVSARDRACSATPRTRPLCSTFGRHRVTKVVKHLTETRLELQSQEEEKGHPEEKEGNCCVLRDSWAHHTAQNVREGDVVNVLGSVTGAEGEVVINDQAGLLIVTPDRLISGTSVVATLFCQRKAVLNEIFKGLEGGNKTMFVGTLVHELLQECLRIKADTTAAINERLEHIMRQKTFLTDMLRLEISSAELRKEVEPFLPHILYFIDRYVTKKTLSSPPEAAFSNSQRPGPAPSVWAGSVKEVVDIEENIWSPRLGMKGKVDLTVRVEMSNAAAASKTLPLELKTGRASGSAEHRGQVIMYSMMMSERRQDPEAGLLLYLRNSSLQEVKAGIHEVRGLVQLRNEAARYLTSKTAEDLEGIYAEPDLPAPIEAKRICAGCTHLVACSMYQKIKVDVSLQAPHAMSELVPEALGHLSEAHEDFFEKWSLMSSLESQKAAGASRLKNLWCKTPSQREVEGTAIFGLKLPHSRTAAPQDNKNVHVFHRASVRNIPAGFQSGETVILSSDRELALSQGVLLEASDDKIVVALDRDLYALAEEFVTGRTYHIDQYQYQGAGSSNMVNLAKLMSNNPRAAKLRRLIVDKEPVTFLKGLSKDVVPVGRHILKSLNKVQQKAAFKTLMAEEYVLLRGLPGTGKTTLIVALVRLLVAMGKSVLLSAYTHSAVDNILLKLAEHADANFLRLGRKSRIHPELKKFSADSIDKGDVDALREAYASFPVIATTCLGLGDPAVTSRTFDYCILDEAGQALLLSAIGPLFHADKFVLVGDPAQLPPVVQSDAARRFGLDVSLFSHLESDDNVIPLNIQYRMNTEIMGCANRLVYNGQLECGSDEVANRCLQISNAFPLPKFDFMAKIFSVAMQDSIVFLDTSHLEQSSTESDTEEGVIKSSLEAGFVLQIVTVLRHASPSSSLGVMAPYRAQVGLLRRTLNLGPAEVNTVDQFQGRDRDVVIYSCTRSTDTEKKNNTDRRDILNDMRRLNVAITRAKSKLVFIGCKKTLLSGYDTFRKLFGLLDERVHHVLTTDDINKD